MNETTRPADPAITLAVAYAPPAARPALATLFALDARLRTIVVSASESSLALIRLIWWRDTLAALDTAPPPAEPLLAELAAACLSGLAMAAMVEGWEALIDDPALDGDGIAAHAAHRGSGLFALAGGVLGAGGAESERLRRAGADWARIDLVRAGLAQRAGGRPRAEATIGLVADGPGRRWPRRLRPLGQLAMLARRDAMRGVDRLEPADARARLARIALFHLTGC